MREAFKTTALIAVIALAVIGFVSGCSALINLIPQ